MVVEFYEYEDESLKMRPNKKLHINAKLPSIVYIYSNDLCRNSVAKTLTKLFEFDYILL